jgi:hypothetical protein
LGEEDYLTFCSYEAPADNENNWACGCAKRNKEECRPFPRTKPESPNDDSDEDCGIKGCEVKNPSFGFVTIVKKHRGYSLEGLL